MKGKIKKELQRIGRLLAFCLMALLLPVQVMASQGTPETAVTSLTIHYKYGQATFTFYKVADFSETGIFQLVEPFAGYKETVTDLDRLEELNAEEWRALAITLDSCVSSDNSIKQIYQGQTDEVGTMVWNNLEKGMYLIVGEMTQDEQKIYKPTPTLVTVPGRDAQGAWNLQVVVEHDKAEVEEIPEATQEYNVLKVWKDTGYEKKRPKEIEVTLLKDGAVYDKVILNKENNWEYCWEDLEAGHEWKVDEVTVPAGYKKSIEKNCQQYVITNTYQTPKTPSSPTNSASSGGGGSSKLPQTGQLWWPVPLLAVLGIAAFMIGWVRRKTDKG